MLKREVEGQLYLEESTWELKSGSIIPSEQPMLRTFHRAFLYSKESPQSEKEEELMLTWGMVFIPSSPGFPPGGHVWSPYVNDRHLILTGNVVDFLKICVAIMCHAICIETLTFEGKIGRKCHSS